MRESQYLISLLLAGVSSCGNGSTETYHPLDRPQLSVKEDKPCHYP
jgi:hypothetical protein